MRKKELSLLNILFCLLVIFIHISSYPLSGYTTGSIPYNGVLFLWRLASFVVQGFVLLSGLKMFLAGNDKPYLKMLVKKLRVIVLPYLVWYFVYYAFYIIIADYPIDIKFMAKHFFLGSLAPHTYFIPLIMQFFILYPLWNLLTKKVKPCIAIPIALLISLFAESCLPVILYNENINFIYNDRIFTTYLSYWLTGCYVGIYYEKVVNFLKKHSLIIPFISAVIVNLIFTYINYNIKYISYLNVIHSFYCLITIFFLLALFLKTKDSPLLKNSFLAPIDKSSYTVYLCHMLFVFISNYLFQTIMGIQSNILLFLTMAVTVYPVSLIVSILVTKLKEKFTM